MRRLLTCLISVSALAGGALAQDPVRPSAALVAAADGAFEAAGMGCTSRFDARGATLRVARADAALPDVALTLRLTDWQRGDRTESVARHAVERRGNGQVRYVHDGIEEHYRLTANGFEQSFVLARQPAGSGDLVLGIAAESVDLHAPAVAAAQQGLQLRAADGAGICYGEAVAFERGGERVAVAMRYDGNGRIELIVPAALLDHARYPLIVDPAVGPLFNPGDAPSWDFEPDAAQALLAGRYMVVWQRDFAGIGYIRAQIFNDDGTPATGLIVVAATGDCAAPCVVHTVVGGLDRFCVVYARNSHIEARLYDLDGNAVTPAVMVATPSAGGANRRPAASGMHDSGVLLAWDYTPSGSPQPREIQARLLSFAGGTISGGVVWSLDALVSGFTRSVRLPKSHLVQTIGGAEWVATRAVWERSQPIVAATPTEVWTSSFRLLAPFGVQYVSLAPTGRVASTASGGDYEELPDIGVVASRGVDPTDERFLIAWQGGPGDVTAALYALAGPLAAPLNIASTGDFETEPAVLAGACEFSVGYRAIGSSQSVLVRSFRPDGTQITTGPTTLRTGPDNYYAIRGAERQLRRDQDLPTNRVLFVWQDGGGPSTGPWDVQARFYQPVGVNVFPFGSGCPGPGGTLPQITAIGVPDPGNSAFRVQVDSTPPGSLAVLVVSDQFTSTPIPGAPGCTLYAGLPFLIALPTVTDPTGSGSVALPIPCVVPPGVGIACQWGILTPGHNAFGWIVSDDIDFSWFL